MEQFLFLFPIEEYFKACLNSCRIFSFKGYQPSELIDIINARYRDNEYGINWLLFSQENNLTKPDLTKIPEYVKIQKQDGILVSGVSFKSHVSKKLYPNPDYVLGQLPEHKKLVVGGFHQWDCVDKIARRSYEKGVETFVDEDTTELFFSRRTLVDIPLIRKKWSLKEELGIPESLYEIAKENRKNKPWFVQS